MNEPPESSSNSSSSSRVNDDSPPSMLRRHDSPDEPMTPGPGASANRFNINIKLDANTLSTIALIAAVGALVWLMADRNHLSETLAQEHAAEQELRVQERVAVRELLARDHETQMAELAGVKRKYDLLDSDWMQMNGYLAASGVHKDAGGFYVKDGKPLQEKPHER